MEPELALVSAKGWEAPKGAESPVVWVGSVSGSTLIQGHPGKEVTARCSLSQTAVLGLGLPPEGAVTTARECTGTRVAGLGVPGPVGKAETDVAGMPIP